MPKIPLRWQKHRSEAERWPLQRHKSVSGDQSPIVQQRLHTHSRRNNACQGSLQHTYWLIVSLEPLKPLERCNFLRQSVQYGLLDACFQLGWHPTMRDQFWPMFDYVGT